mgnify:CR=1 FL=1
MEITIFKKPIDGLLQISVSLYEFTDNRAKTVEVTVWVPEHDSRAILESTACAAAIVQLKRTLSALESVYHSE